MEMGKSLYKLLVTASEDEDVNCCVTRTQQGTEQALLCGVQSNLISYQPTSYFYSNHAVWGLFVYFCF